MPPKSGRPYKRLAALLVACTWAIAVHGAPPSEERGTIRVEPREQDRPVTEGLAKLAKLRAAHVHAVRLAAPSREKSMPAGRPSKGAPLRIGFGRPVPELQTEAATASALEWEPLADGSRVADLAITSPGASAVRAGIRVGELPDAALLRFKGPGDEKLFDAAGRKVNEAIAANVDSGDASDEARTYWSPVIDGDTIVMEIELPPDVDPRGVRIAVPQVSHLFTSAASTFSTPTLIGQSGTCEVDASCSTGWSNQQNAVAEMVFNDGTGTFLCTGTLLADQDTSTNVPYFLSANHCISTPTAASTLTTYWFYRSSSCGSAVPGPYQQLTGGATLLYHSASTDGTAYTDTSFMRLDNTPPLGTFFAGWFVGATPGLATGVTGLHQPSGDLLKISQGAIGGYSNCTPPSGTGFTCNNVMTPSSSKFYDVGWTPTKGVTEPGSSGSGLFLGSGYLVGQLYGGSGDCANPGTDFYGRFDAAYNVALKTWLSPPLTLTVTESGTGAGTVSSSPAGIACGGTCSASFTAGTSVALSASASAGSVFAGWGGACSGTGGCTVAMGSPVAVTATFDPSTPTLTVSTSAGGVVASSPAGINCGATCVASYGFGTVVTLSAAPDSGMAFKGWSGACSGTGSCVVTMNGALSVAAAFGPPSSVDVALAQWVSPNPATVGGNVVFTMTVTNNGPDAASGVTLTDTLAAGSTFVSASSGCSNASGVVTCSLGSMAIGASVNLGVIVQPTSAGSIANDASVTASEADPSTGNNSSSVSATVDATPAATLTNVSTRMRVLTGNDVLIGGFIVGGSTGKTVVVRARGPSLAAFGITNALANPTLTLVRSSDQSTLAANDDWQSAANASQVSASGFAPSDPHESAILVALPPGAYTAIVSGAGGGTGVGMVEVFEVDHPEVPLTNLSTRGQVLTGNDVMIGGFVVQGSGAQTVIVRARGPSLTQFGITNALANPTLQLVRSSDQTTVATNDDWVSSPNAAQISTSGFAPSDAHESAILVTLDPGAYTAVVSGVGGTTGVGLVEVFAQ